MPTPARATAAEQFANYERLPSYRSMLDKQGAAHPEGRGRSRHRRADRDATAPTARGRNHRLRRSHIRLRRRAHAHRRVPGLARADALARSIPSPSGELRVNQLQSAPRRRGRVAPIWSRRLRLRGGRLCSVRDPHPRRRGTLTLALSQRERGPEGPAAFAGWALPQEGELASGGFRRRRGRDRFRWLGR